MGILYSLSWEYNIVKGGGIMIDFEPLWQTMKRKNITCYALINKYGVSRGMIDKLKHNRNVTLETVARLCDILDCEIQDIVIYKKEKKQKKE